ncbi:MAG TPA: HPF/RaiA family ribosome-associated protein [Flavitalea sp.]|nr:HPF/RaiA family ribosome-associated protein [Flavitalea sp.]
MIIEFHSSPVAINDNFRENVSSRLLKMEARETNFSKADVFFAEKRGSKDALKICEIDLQVSDSSLFVHRESASFEDAFQEVLDELYYRIELKKTSQSLH